MNMKNILFTFFVILFSFNAQAQENQSKNYFDLKSFIAEQVEKLEKINPSVEKSTTHNSEIENKTTNEIDWQKELQLFVDSDINKAILKDAYKITENAQTIDYQALILDLKVQNIHIEKENGVVKKLNIVYKDSNNLFEIEKKLQLELSKNYITNYQIEIIQKIIFKDRDHYKVSGKILP